ncbi:bifunctional 6-phosphofructo-2-kinase/fructose-2,6-bisphosphate 2-phosphatase [Violaceomyces palustris]|uniref:Bifunctional 6-phosphofructo-2-kinase/fructose-2,6-bisphosphate 2-phosphatase n=1 Tax=Violaceomyces palustris TaxID=1673888 RepID=A0ACD0NMV8_9BASI|nr:bifunctional 6-phosphofructo-2-kinase/fructose-2,6-bisphosphate 2-phosphatase [Violaceomyces palustris]
MAAPLYTTASGQLFHAGKILIATVGLPARGKTHLSHAIERYLRWLGVKTKVFSLGDYRRKMLGGADKIPKDYFKSGPKSPETEALRKEILNGLDEGVINFFDGGGQVVIYDANNGQQARRYAIREKFGKLGIHVMFLESICTDKSIVEANVRSVKLSSPDYVGWDPEKAVQDFYSRISGHEKFYEPIENPSFPYIKLINVGEQVVVNNIQGYLQSRIVFFLMNIHNRQRTIYFARAGEALIEHLYKADADLSSLGWDYSDELCNFLINLRKGAAARSIEKAQGETEAELAGRRDLPGAGPGEEGRPLEVWTSARRRSSHTAYPFAEKGYRVIERSQLSEMNPGVVDGMSAEEIIKRYPDEWEKKQKEPYSHRFPRAESYHDLSVRLEPIIFELERARSDVLIIGQSSVLRCLIAYYQGMQPHEIPSIQVREGELVEIRPEAYGVSTRIHNFWDPVARRQERDRAFECARQGCVDEDGEERVAETQAATDAEADQSDAVPNSQSQEEVDQVGRRGRTTVKMLGLGQGGGGEEGNWMHRRDSSSNTPEGIRADAAALRKLEQEMREAGIKESSTF